MSETSAGKNKPKQEQLRMTYYDEYGLSDDPTKKPGTARARCALTGRSGKLKLAHLLPASSDADIKNSLKISSGDDGIWSFRNVLLLSWNIEYYFDRKKLSFVQNALHADQFDLKIWDSAVAQELIFDGAEVSSFEGDNKIGYCVGRPLNLVMPNGKILQPFIRCLSYQAFMSFCAAKLLHGDIPNDFSSDYEGNQDWLSKRRDFLVMRKSLDKIIESESEEELLLGDDQENKEEKEEDDDEGDICEDDEVNDSLIFADTDDVDILPQRKKTRYE
eukprot:gene36618-44421_t